MRILYVITRADLGGAQVHVLKLLKGFAGRENSAVACGEEGILTTQARDLGIPIFLVPDLVRSVSPRRDFRAYRQLRRVIRAWKPDVVHCHSSKAGIVGRLAARAADTASVFTAHGWAFDDGAGWKRKLLSIPCEWLAGRIGDEVIVTCNYQHNLGIRYGAARLGRVHLVYDGTEDTPLRAQPGDAGTPKIAMVARFSQQKDHDTLLRALSGIERSFSLWLIGDGPLMEATRAEADRRGLISRISFLGPRTDVPELLAKVHIFVLASKFEALPMCVMEAMRASLPIIASNVGGMHELVEDGRTGFLVEPCNADALQRKIEILLADAELREKLGNGSRRLYEERFRATAIDIADRTFEVYERALEQRRSLKPARCIPSASQPKADVRSSKS